MAFFNKIFPGGKATIEEQKPESNPSEAKRSTARPAAEPGESEQSQLQLTLDDILLGQNTVDKVAALQLISDQMLKSGYVSEDYLPALLERESKVSTFLINGVAIPHGAIEAKHLVVRTGIVVAQFPKGVTWSEKGEVVKLAVGIAANGNEHLKILTQLTNVVMDEALATHLGEKANAKEIAEALGQKIESTAAVAEDYPTKAEAVIVDREGMHARPASLISEAASKFTGTEILLRNNNRSANAKSMAEILSMGATEGDRVTVSASGKEADTAVDALVSLINAGLDDNDEGGGGFSNYDPLDALPPLDDPQGKWVFRGASASPGIAVAPVHIFQEEEQFLEQKTTDTPGELALLDDALRKASEQLDSLYQGMKQHAPKEAAIFRAQAQLLSDDVILKSTRQFIGEGNEAAWSWNRSVKDQVTALKAVADERIKARVADMNDVASRVIRILENKSGDFGFPQDEDFILVASELTPSQTACLDTLPVKAICTELGGPNSHMAILARALGIPAIVGIGNGLTRQVETGELAIVDPQSSCFIISPDEKTIAQAQGRIDAWNRIKDIENAQKFERAVTTDNYEIEVVCNIAKPKEAQSVLDNGGEGVGLLRTEFMFEASKVEPTIDEQVTALQAIVTTLGSRQLVVRTADIGGDKPVSWLDMPHEDNPFLGVRGIRHSFRHEGMFRHQLEAIYRVALWQFQNGSESGIHIMFPMISRISEWRKAREIAEQVRNEVGAPKLPLGIMVEVPSTALLAEHFAKEVDFFSIGSNDLTQYTLAMDRLHPDLAGEADSFSPALLKLISMTVQAADANGKWVGVCGNMAADPDLACILLGLGVKEISVSPANIPALKLLIRSVSYKKLRDKARKALTLESSAELRKLYKNRADLT